MQFHLKKDFGPNPSGILGVRRQNFRTAIATMAPTIMPGWFISSKSVELGFFVDMACNICYRPLMIPSQVKSIRKALGLTQQKLADVIGAHRESVARWETGRNEPRGANLKTLRELAEKAKKKTKRIYSLKIPG